MNYLPSGPTAMIFALLAQYYATIPHTFRFRIGTTSTPSSFPSSSSATTTSTDETTATTQQSPTPKPAPPSLTLLLSDKTTTYIVAAQLALSQFPATLLPAAVGWFVGLAWRAELLPGLSPGAHGFRVPAWVVGERERRGGGVGSAAGAGAVAGSGSAAERERFEDLRRRLEGEVAASTSGLESGGGQRRRNAGSGIMERLRGAW